MKNALPQFYFTSEIQSQAADSKRFYRFIAIFQKHLENNQILVNSNLIIKLINQPIQQDLQKLDSKDHVLVFGQIIQQGKLIQGQVKRITVEESLRYENLMKKMKYRVFQKPTISSINYSNLPTTFGSGGNISHDFIQHF